jgi:A/G-specific adenine glycosylase
MDFAKKITRWYQINHRELPWRATRDAYKIWLSEVILQQTRVLQGMPFYHSFIQSFPTVCKLAEANEDQVLKLWQGLGYYSRARNLHSTAKYVCKTLNGRFPETFDELKKLKGIGNYTAAAIASVAFGQQVPAVDGNVHRVLSRVYGLTSAAGSPKAFKECFDLSGQLMTGVSPSEYNQALMDLGALICTPKQPKCIECPVSDNCIALRDNLINEIPVKKKKIVRQQRYFYYIALKSATQLVLQKRNAGDIWAGLYEFPLIESQTELTENYIFESSLWKSLNISSKTVSIKISKTYKHILSHQDIFAQFFIVQVDSLPDLTENIQAIDIKSIRNYAVSRLTDRFMEEMKLYPEF